MISLDNSMTLILLLFSFYDEKSKDQAQQELHG